jgi:hypothetical protein
MLWVLICWLFKILKMSLEKQYSDKLTLEVILQILY